MQVPMFEGMTVGQSCEWAWEREPTRDRQGEIGTLRHTGLKILNLSGLDSTGGSCLRLILWPRNRRAEGNELGKAGWESEAKLQGTDGTSDWPRGWTEGKEGKLGRTQNGARWLPGTIKGSQSEAVD